MRMSTHKWLKKIAFAILSVLAITLVLAYSITDSYQYEVTLPIKEEAFFSKLKEVLVYSDDIVKIILYEIPNG